MTAVLVVEPILLLQNFRCISSRCAADSPSTMDSASAEIQVIDGRLMIRPARNRTHEQELIEHELTVVEVTFGESVGLFEVKRRNQFAIYD